MGKRKLKKDKHIGENGVYQLMKGMTENDVLIMTKIAYISRTLSDTMTILSGLLKKKTYLYCLQDRFLFDNSVNRESLSMWFGLIAEMEHNLVSMRTREALDHRKNMGEVLGRPKGSDLKQSLLDNNRNEIIRMMEEGESVVAICRHFGISRNTFYQFKKNYGL
ncbi:MAG: recombinase family protein [Tannerellaceae bacterium]|nr:recombinase family protein [Tannerellaceae bacterium]MCD8265401.1 recombinase family protein [Tannerellaceae bacterium]